MAERLILDIGCGERKISENATGLDVRKTSSVDVVADAGKLTFKTKVFITYMLLM